MGKESVSAVLKRVEEESYAINRHIEFKRCYEHYRSQATVIQSIKLALEDMHLQKIIDDYME